MADDDAAPPGTGPRARKAAAKKAPATRAPAKRTTAKKTVAKKTTAAATTGAKKATAKKAAAGPGTKAATKKAAPSAGGRATGAGRPRLREAPAAAEPVREDPNARMRAILRAAAASIEGRDAGASASRPVPPSVPVAPERSEEVTRVLIAPVAAFDEAEDAGDWAPPDVIEAAPIPAPVPARASSAPPPSPPATAATPVVIPEPRPTRAEPRRPRRRLWLLVVVLVVAVIAAGVIVFALGRDRGVDYSKLKVGDCFDSATSNEVRGVKVKPCSKPHNSEIFFLVNHPAAKGEAYPGKDQLVQFAADACLGQPLTDYLGVPLERSKLKDFEIVPQESAWKDGRRLLVCGVDTGGAGSIKGSVKGTGR